MMNMMDNQVEHIFRRALSNYNGGSEKKRNYAVCWYSCLITVVYAKTDEAYSDKDENIYRIQAENRRNATRQFLTMKARSVFRAQLDYKKRILYEIVKSTFKYGRMKCLEVHPDLKNLSYDIETVIDGEYYSMDPNDNREKTLAMADAVLKNVDHESVSELLTPELFIEVFIESHLYDVAVIELEPIEK